MSHDVLNAPPADDQTVLHEAILAVEAKRKGTLVQSLTRWRLLITAMADGKCGGKHLADLATLADELRLPAGALAADVAALKSHRADTLHLEATREEVAKLQAAAELANTEVPQLERRLRDCRIAIQRCVAMQPQPAHIIGGMAQTEQQNPRLFGSIEHVADRILGATR